MLKPMQLANALAIITVASELVLWLLSRLLPPVFTFVYNAMFLGANAAPYFPPTKNVLTLLIVLVITGALSWGMGYAIAYLYNRLERI